MAESIPFEAEISVRVTVKFDHPGTTEPQRRKAAQHAEKEILKTVTAALKPLGDVAAYTVEVREVP